MKKSSFVEGTIIATLSIFIVKILGMLYVIPFYQMISIKGSALYAYAYNIYVIFLDISTAGLPLAISKIISEYNTLDMQEAKQRSYKIGKRILMIAAIAIFIILMLFAPQIANLLIGDLKGGNTIGDVSLAIRCVSFSILVVPFLSVAKGYLQGHNIINVSSVSQIIEQVIRIAIILLGVYLALYVFNIGETLAICIALTGAFFGALFAWIYVEKKIKDNKKQLSIEEFKVKDDVQDRDIIKKIFNYALPFIIINTIYSIYNFCDMVLILRTMDFLGMNATDVEFVTSSITTWAPKINMIVSSISMGMTVSLIPTIVSAFTLKKWGEVNNKLNQALQMIIMISLPMAVGLAILSKPVWSVFYGLKNTYGPMILSITIFVTFVANVYMIASSTLQSLNKFKLVYKSAVLGFILNLLLDVPIMMLFNCIGIPPFLGAGTASIIGYGSASLYVLYVLRKEHNLRYGKTFRLIYNLIIPIVLMILGVLVTMKLIPVNYDSKLSCIIYIAVNAIVGALIYGFLLYKKGILKDVLGDRLFGLASKFDRLKNKLNKKDKNIYSLVVANEKDIEQIIKFKTNNIFAYAKDIDEKEKKKIQKYVEKDISSEISNYKMIMVDNKVVGTIGVIDYEDSKMIDEIFIEEEYRNKGIGTSIIKDILDKYDGMYLWVYKDNKEAIKLYKRFNFEVVEDTENRYLMKMGNKDEK